MAQASHPTFINLPPPGSNPETPSEMPGTPTSTTTSLSALSTTAIKDGHRGHFPSGHLGRGHQHNPSTSSLEAERADRISRLAGLERVSTLRAPPNENQAAGSVTGAGAGGQGASSLSPQTTPTSTTGFPPNYPAQHSLTPAYFDNNGQPVAVTKMSTVGTASATESHVDDDGRTTAAELRDDEDMLSTDTNYRGTAGSVASMGADADAMMDEDPDMEGGPRSVGGYEDRMSDDGSASLVGFGEGAGSTVSGPIYHRRPMPPGSAAAAQHAWSVERTNSGLSDSRRERDTPMGGGDTPISASAMQERREARAIDGVATDPRHQQQQQFSSGDQEGFVDTTFRGPVPAAGQSQQAPETNVERIVERLDSGETRHPPLTSPGRGPSGGGGDRLGQFYFEGGEKKGE